jgi:hypothetical protein
MKIILNFSFFTIVLNNHKKLLLTSSKSQSSSQTGPETPVDGLLAITFPSPTFVPPTKETGPNSLSVFLSRFQEIYLKIL